jgi:RimJ/RimL family protein N-acetyltransferase
MSSPAPESTGPEFGVVITTPRLLLRAVCDADIPELHRKIFGVPDVMGRVFAGATLSLAESESFVRANFDFTGAPTGLAVLVDRSGGDILGFAGLIPCAALSDDDLEIGFVLAREAWGRGFATEIGQAQLAFGFQQLERPRLLALVAEDNTASVHTLEKLRMRHHSDIQPPGRGPRRVYCLSADEWRRAKPE